MILTKTPLRISLVGGGSDLPAFYEKEPGAVLSFTIDKHIYIVAKKHFSPDQIRVSYSVTENVSSAGFLEHELVRQVLLQAGIFSGIEIVSVADVPGEGSGLGSSSVYLVGLLNAVHGLQGTKLSPNQLAELAFHIEADNLQKPVGKQDHYAAAYGGINWMQFTSDLVEVHRLEMQDQIIPLMETRLMLFWTGITRSSSGILAEQKENTRKMRHTLSRMVEQTVEMKDALMKADMDTVGALLGEGWARKKELADSISNEMIDHWYEHAMKAGALGGKICGAGGGGFLLLCSQEGYGPSIREEMEELGLKEMPFKITTNGSEVVYEG